MSDLISPEARAALKEVLGTFQIHRIAAQSMPQSEDWDEDYPGEDCPRQTRVLIALQVLTLQVTGGAIDEGSAHVVADMAPLPKDIANHPMSIEEMTPDTQERITEALMGGAG